jgi:hypothetical protein
MKTPWKAESDPIWRMALAGIGLCCLGLLSLSPKAAAQTEVKRVALSELIENTAAYRGQIVIVRGLIDECVVSCTLAVTDTDERRLSIDPNVGAMLAPQNFRFAEVEMAVGVLMPTPGSNPATGYDLTPTAPPLVITPRASRTVAKPGQPDDRLVRLAPGSMPELSTAAREVFAEIGARDAGMLEYRHALIDPPYAAMLDKAPEERQFYRMELTSVLFEGVNTPAEGLAEGGARSHTIALFQDPATEADFVKAMAAEAAISVCICLKAECQDEDWPVQLVDTLPNRANPYHCVDAVKRNGRWRPAPF